MRQYITIKEQYPDVILLFRMGDFYELFMDDAKIAAPLMDVSLTARQGGVPMAGVPFHSADMYISRLLKAGRRVAVAEQEVDPSNPKLMSRRVRRVLSPGTLVEESLLTTSGHNFLMAIVLDGMGIGVALADVSTGDFFAHEATVTGEDKNERARVLRDLVARYHPGEMVSSTDDLPVLREMLPDVNERLVPMEPWKASPSEGLRRLERNGQVYGKGLGFDRNDSPSLGAVSLVYHYIQESFPDGSLRMDPPVLKPLEGERIFLDEQTVRNLDLVENIQERGRERTLFKVLDHCRTATGRRFLKEQILSPLFDPELIGMRLDAVECFAADPLYFQETKDGLDLVGDLERLVARMSSGRGTPADFATLRTTLFSSEKLGQLAKKKPEIARLCDGGLPPDPGLLEFAKELERMVEDEPPVSLSSAPFLREGIDENLDRARKAGKEGQKWILQFEEEERKKTGIPTLKVKYNRVVGYFIEVSKARAGDVPDDYRRKQTLVGNERYTCERLSSLEETILGAEDEINRIEGEVFKKLCERTVELSVPLKQLMGDLAMVDTLLSFARSALDGRWVRPVISENHVLKILEGRHPVVEKYLDPGEPFIPNDLNMEGEGRSFAIITGPNMAGKSTYIRQTALIQILAQIGSFVPAREATLPLVDNVFTRIGASDNLTRGESTFFVEMLETARILNRCTSRSLVVMDEVGRGTSTYDGMSIAWAIVEHLSGPSDLRPLALFATHYHELTVLEARKGVFNLTMDVQEIDGRVVFLRKVREGAADDSYGIHVARLAGLPPEVVERAQEKLKELESEMVEKKEVRLQSKLPAVKRKKENSEQFDLFG